MFFEDKLFGRELNAHCVWHITCIVRCARSDPTADHPVVFAVLLEKFSAGVGNCTNGFLQQQALLGNSVIDASSDHLIDDSMVITFGVIAEQRKHESVHAARGSVACSCVASRSEEDGHYVTAETGSFFCSV